MPDRSFSPGTPDVQRHAERGDPVKFQCLIGHSVPGLLLIVSVSSVLASEFQCLIGHSVPGHLSDVSTPQPLSEEFQCLIGHSVPGLRIEYTFDITGLPPS